jgi:hypothetical protein
MPKTITFSEKNNGWTSEFDYIPDAMCRLNNRFFMIKDGQLHLANDKDNPIRNNFFGVQYDSKVTTVFNENPNDDKVFKTLIEQSNKPWSAVIRTNYTNSTLKKEEFAQRESRQFAHLRKSEDVNDFRGGASQGIGVIVSNSGLDITFTSISETVSIGDQLYQLNGGTNELIGTITAKTGTVITVDAVVTEPVNGYFAFSKKNSRVEGAEMRGYYMEVELTNTDTEFVELFAIESNAVRSRL